MELAKDSSILKYVDAEVFRSGNHIARLNAEETLSSYAFLNSDGSKTVYYLAEEVKYVDASGKIREKDLTLTSAVGGYTTASNDVGLTLPNNPANGISLTYGNYSISLIPQGGTLRKALALENNAVTYVVQDNIIFSVRNNTGISVTTAMQNN